MASARDRFIRELEVLRGVVGGSFTGVPASGDAARRLSLHCRKPDEPERFSVSFVEDTGPVPDLLGSLPPSGVRVMPPETSGLWRAQVEALWSMPKPEGPGRSIKLVVVSADHPGDVLGWLELASAPLVMGERDRRYPVSGPNARVDLRTVGAHPDFAAWRGSSLIGLLGLTDAVLQRWERRYGDRPELVQTTGAFGVSAVYERKRLRTGRRWTRAQMTSGTYSVLPDAIVDAAREMTGATGTRHPVEDGKLTVGRDNMRLRMVLNALAQLGYSHREQRHVTTSLGVRRALYACPVEPTYSRDPALEVQDVYEWWLERYAREPNGRGGGIRTPA